MVPDTIEGFVADGAPSLRRTADPTEEPIGEAAQPEAPGQGEPERAVREFGRGHVRSRASKEGACPHTRTRA